MLNMKNRTYVARCYITINEEDVLNYLAFEKGEDREEFFKKGYIITNADWNNCANDEICYGEYGYDELEFLKETEE